MLKNEILDDFLNDANASVATMDQIKTSKTKISNIPLLRKMEDYFDSNLHNEIQLQIPHVKKIIASESLNSLGLILKEFESETLKNSFYTFPASGYSNDFSQNCILPTGNYFDLSINVINKKSLAEYKNKSYQSLEERGIGFYGKHQLVYFIKADGFEISTWKYQKQKFTNINLVDLKCEKQCQRVVSSGDFIYFQPHQCMMFERAKSNVLMLVFEFKSNSFPLALMFSAKDFTLKFQNPTHIEHSRIQLFFTLLKEFDSQMSIPIIKQYLSHELHFVRWHAMQELLGLNAISVLKELKDMSVNDTHFEVRNAAGKTLDMISQVEGC